MKANEFVKKFGWKEAKNIVDASEIIGIDANIVDINQLKRLVGSHELVESCGGLKVISEKSFRLDLINNDAYMAKKLNKAITDVESCR